MTTIGLGGDSEVTVLVEASTPRLCLGPRRVVPVSMIAVHHPELVHRILDQQLLQDVAGEHDARFVLPLADFGASTAGLDAGELALLQRARVGVVGVATLIRGNADLRRLDRLVSRGLLMLAAFTPTDASHVLGDYVTFDSAAAEKAARLMARKRTMLGKPVAKDAQTCAEWVVSTLQRRSAETILGVALRIDGFEGNGLSRHPLVAASLDRRVGVAEVSIRLSIPLIGLGASAALYYPEVAAMLRAQGIVPPDADVANAIGAVVGRVRVHVDVYVSSPERDRFRVHHPSATSDLFVLDEALALADQLAADDAGRAAVEAGAGTADVIVDRVVNMATVEGDDFFVDATVTATASGRPRQTRT